MPFPPCTVELIRQKVQARKDASRNHRSSRAEERRDKADKVRSIRPTQPKLFAPPSVPKVVSRCPGTHLPIFGAPAAPGAPLPATTPKVVAQAASTPASSWMHHAAATVVGAAHNAASIVAAFGSAAKAGSAQRAPVRALERSPFVALKSEKKLTVRGSVDHSLNALPILHCQNRAITRAMPARTQRATPIDLHCARAHSCLRARPVH